MTRKNSNRTSSEIKAMMAEDGDFLRPMVRTIIQEFLEAEMAEAVGAEKGERVEGRLGCGRRLTTQLDYAGGQAGTESSAGPPRTVFHRDFLSAISAARRPWWRR